MCGCGFRSARPWRLRGGRHLGGPAPTLRRRPEGGALMIPSWLCLACLSGQAMWISQHCTNLFFAFLFSLVEVVHVSLSLSRKEAHSYRDDGGRKVGGRQGRMKMVFSHSSSCDTQWYRSRLSKRNGMGAKVSWLMVPSEPFA